MQISFQKRAKKQGFRVQKNSTWLDEKILYSTPRWQKVVRGKMVESITKLRTAVEELGGKISVRY